MSTAYRRSVSAERGGCTTAGEKTEQATPKRKQDERKKGNIFQSQEVLIVFTLLATFYSLKLLGPWMLGTIKKGVADYLGMLGTVTEITAEGLQSYFIDGCIIFASTALPLLMIGGLTAIVLTLAQTRLLVSTKSMAFKANRMNPLQGLKKLFSMRAMVEMIKAIAKIVVLGFIVYNVFMDYVPSLPDLMDMEVGPAIEKTGEMILSIVQSVAIASAFVAAADYFYQWWDYEKNLRMSKQEIKEEYKQTEGDPQVKGKIKERQQQQARRRMMQNVPSADVVIRNPTHYAVAIKYIPERNSAPMVVAKGVDSLALRIVAVAEEHNVTVIENRPLARGLYETVDLDREIPETYYQAVAEVLAFVYSIKKEDLK